MTAVYDACTQFSTHRLLIRHQRSENSPFAGQNFPANVRYPMTILYSDMEPLSHYSPVMFHLSPSTRILNERPEHNFCHHLLLSG